MQLNTGEQALKSLHLRLLMSWRVVGGGIKTQECLLLIKNNKKKLLPLSKKKLSEVKMQRAQLLHMHSMTPILYQASPPSACDL